MATTKSKTTPADKINTGITVANSKKVADALNEILADEFVLYVKTLKFHWNIEGRDFHALHIFLEEQYNQLQAIIDSVAERIRKVGHFANGSLKQFLSDTGLKEHAETNAITEDKLRELVSDHESIIRKVRECIDDFDEQYKDQGSADFVTGLLKQHEKMAWMLRASVSK